MMGNYQTGTSKAQRQEEDNKELLEWILACLRGDSDAPEPEHPDRSARLGGLFEYHPGVKDTINVEGFVNSLHQGDEPSWARLLYFSLGYYSTASEKCESFFVLFKPFSPFKDNTVQVAERWGGGISISAGDTEGLLWDEFKKEDPEFKQGKYLLILPKETPRCLVPIPEIK